MKVIFSSNNKPFSLVIKLVTASMWHHCGVIFDNNPDVVYEARLFGGVQINTTADFKSRGKYQTIDIPLLDENSAKDYAISQLGKKYDLMGILALLINRSKLQNPDKLYCSEYVANICKAGLRQIIRNGVNGVTPRDIYLQLYK